jgi:FMN phosphatase YigB (HAD superfamily)
VLFDVDGTLLLTHDEVYVEASRLALEAVFGINAEGPDVPGDTAPAHIRRALRTVNVPEAEPPTRATGSSARMPPKRRQPSSTGRC